MKPLFFIDTETTGLKDARLIQLAFMSDVGVSFNHLYKPPTPIDIEAMEVHHVTQKMVDDKPSFSIVVERVKDLIKGGIIVAHNAEFDLRVLEAEGIFIHEWICTKKVAKHLWPDFKAHRLQYLRYRLGIEVDAGAHEAMADVKVLQAVFAECLKAWNERYKKPETAIEEMVRLSTQ